MPRVRLSGDDRHRSILPGFGHVPPSDHAEDSVCERGHLRETCRARNPRARGLLLLVEAEDSFPNSEGHRNVCSQEDNCAQRRPGLRDAEAKARDRVASPPRGCVWFHHVVS